MRTLNGPVWRAGTGRHAVGNGKARSSAAGRRLVPAAALLAAALAVPAAAHPGEAYAAAAGRAAALSPAGGGCAFQPVNGGFQFLCADTSAVPGAPGSGGGGRGGPTSACTLTPLSAAQSSFLGLQPAPANHSFASITCPGAQPFGGVTLVSNAAAVPAVTPQELSQVAVAELLIPPLQPKTAPPRGRAGLVGLPEWFWIPRPAWGPISKTVTAGAVWARATASPQQIVFNPGGGLPGATCNGPGTAYQPALPPSAQHTTCSYTYDQPSAGEPGNAYAASVTVLWNVSWVGSGGTGGPVATGRPVSTPLTLPVAAGEAVVTGR